MLDGAVLAARPETNSPASTAGRAESPCPACHYDLHGHAGLKDAVSTSRLTCPECGRESSVGEIMGFEAGLPAWSFEHGLRVSPWRWLRTAVRVFTPGRFWRDLAVRPSVRPWRWWVFAASWVVLMHAGLGALLAASQGANCLLATRWFHTARGFDLEGVLAAAWKAWPYGELSVQVAAGSYNQTPLWVLIMPALPMGIVPAMVVGFAGMVIRPGRQGELRWAAAWAGSVQLSVCWALGIPAIFWASLVWDVLLRRGAPAPSGVLLVAWMLGGLAWMGMWWYRALRTTCSWGTAGICSALGLVAGVGATVLLAFVLAWIGLPV